MKIKASRVRISATDLSNFIRCKHLTRLQLAEAHGVKGLPPKAPRFAKIENLKARGQKHELDVLATLKAKYGAVNVAEIPDRDTVPSAAARAALTRDAVLAGKSLIYQGVLLTDDDYGAPDFLIKARLLDEGEDEGAYAVIDAKLARSAKATAVLQAAFYSRLFEQIYGLKARWMYLQLGDGEPPAPFRVADYDAYELATRDRLREAVATPAPMLPILDPYPEKVEHCQICDWRDACAARRRADDDLSLVAGATAKQRKLLKASGVTRLANLASAKDETGVPSMDAGTFRRLQLQALAQVKTREQAPTEPPFSEFADDGPSLKTQLVNSLRHVTASEPREPLRGLFALPEKNYGDIFFDLEASRFYGGGAEGYGLEYLFGYVRRVDGGKDDPRWEYAAEWALDLEEERIAFENFIRMVYRRWNDYPEMHVYHYNHYEPTALGRLADRHGTMAEMLGALMGRYGTMEQETDALLRGRVFVDLYPIFRQAIRAGIENYSLKSTEKVAGFARAQSLNDATESLIAFEAKLEEGPAAAGADTPSMDTIEAYNREDCEATLTLRDWLEDQRAALEELLGEIPRPATPLVTPPPVAGKGADRRDQLLKHRDDGDDAARALLTELLEYQRRDGKPAWWEYFRVRALDEEGLLSSRSALGELAFVGLAAQPRGGSWPISVPPDSSVFEFQFAPQEHGFSAGDELFDPRQFDTVTPGRDGPAWQVVEIDDRTGRLLAAGPETGFDPKSQRIPSAFVEAGPPTRYTPTQALGRYADLVIAQGGSLDVHPLAAAMLRRTPPPIPSARIEASAGSSAAAVARAIGISGCLPIQGPPGTGKTYTGAEIACALLEGDAGIRIGVMGPSHKAVTNFLEELGARRSAHKAKFGIGQYVSEDKRATGTTPWSGADEKPDSSKQALKQLADGKVKVLGGTAWLWSGKDALASVDTLIIDEAGQVPLAFAVAAATAAQTRVILLGDPQQLAQVTQGKHPEGAGASALEHLLGEASVVTDERGVFLAHTRRMHDDITAFISRAFYQGELSVESSLRLERQSVVGVAPLSGSGLRLCDVDHQGNGNSSPEEAEAVADLVVELLQREWVDREDARAQLGEEDVRVVTPYNAQIRAITLALAERDIQGVEVGTVDKFQGQQAAVIVYSMATSTPEEAPRGMEFLYQLNRLNVAISRAKAMAVVVMSPELVRVDCKTPRQMQLASAHCLMRDRSVLL